MRPLPEAGDEAGAAARRAARGEQGRLAVGFVGSATYELLPGVVRAHHERYPEVTLDLHGEMLTAAQLDGLLDGSLAVGVLRPPTQAEGVVVEVLRQEKLVALLPVQHPLAGERAVRLAALSGEWFLSHPGQPPSAMYGAMLQACRQAGFLPRVRQEVKKTATLVALVAAGLGVALVPASVQRLHLGGTAHRPLAPPCREVALALAYRDGEVSPLLLPAWWRVCADPSLGRGPGPCRPMKRVTRVLPESPAIVNPSTPDTDCSRRTCGDNSTPGPRPARRP